MRCIQNHASPGFACGRMRASATQGVGGKKGKVMLRLRSATGERKEKAETNGLPQDGSLYVRNNRVP